MGAELRGHNVERRCRGRDGFVCVEVMKTRSYRDAKKSGLVDGEKNMEQTARENQRYREKERWREAKPKAASVLTAFCFQFQPPFLKSLAKIHSNIFCLQLHSNPFPF